jgi:hypothetical protein
MRLSPDILVCIIRWCMPTSGILSDEPNPPLPLQVIATHVCRWWRAVGIECATLWSTIDLNRMDMARVFLKRSRQALLSLRIIMHNTPAIGGIRTKTPSKACSTSDVYDVLHAHGPRIKALLIRGSEADYDDLEEQLTESDTCFPALQHFDAGIHGQDDVFDIIRYTTLHALLRRGPTPIALEKLKLDLCVLDFPAIDLSCLTSLHLTYWQPLAVEHTEWWDLLASARRLQSLFIGNALMMPVLERATLIHFPCMTHIVLWGPIRACTVILDAIRIPIGARILADEGSPTYSPYHNADSTREEEYILKPFFARHYSGLPAHENMTFQYQPSCTSGVHRIKLQTVHGACIVIGVESISSDGVRNFNWLISQLPVHVLERISFCSVAGTWTERPWFTGCNDWAQLCNRMPRIRFLHVDSTIVDHCLHYAIFSQIDALHIWYNENPRSVNVVPHKAALFAFWARQPAQNQFWAIHFDDAFNAQESHGCPTNMWPIPVRFWPHAARDHFQQINSNGFEDI